MSTFIMLTRLDPQMTRTSQSLESLEKTVMSHVRKECPDVKWINSFATLGPYDYVDVFQAKDVETAIKVSTLFRVHGHTHTEIWPASEWARFKELMRGLSKAA